MPYDENLFRQFKLNNNFYHIMKKAIVLGGSRGIGKAISDSLKKLDFEVISASSTDIDTSNLESVNNFAKKNNSADVLVLNTGGPPIIEFQKITNEDWNKYHNQLFVGFCTLLQKIIINDGGYIFAITSNVIKEPNSKLIISSAYRAAFSSVFKILSKEFASREITMINIAPGPINTDRTKELVDDVGAYADSLPMKRLGEPEEIGNFVSSILEKKIKYLSGVVINFDGSNSSFVY
jgi:3-oxoacyl-[acyl-carrier protein] reductase